MRRLITIICFSCLVSIVWAQTVLEEIAKTPFLSSNNYCVYPDRDDHQYTEAPAGKKPFYISHYGRHGSRYLSRQHAYDIPFGILSKADSAGKLTPLGKDVFRQVIIAREDVKDRNGELTELGNRQHHHIARRMMEHFPEVFEGKAHIDARSTTKIRCILSMGAALQQMVSLNPELQIHRMDASQHDMWYMNYQDQLLKKSRMTPAANDAYTAFTKKREHNERLMSILFNDTAYVRQEVDDATLNYYLFKVASIQQNTHLSDSLHLLDIFTNEELYRIWQKENVWWYINFGACLLNGGKQPFTQRNLLRKIIEEADSCIALTQHGATLRYGHETIVLPLTCLLELNGYGMQTMDLEEVEKNGWVAYRVFPMGTNLQFIFYRTDPFDHDVIIKVLLNEEEATLPIQTDIAPYYHWSDFKDYYLKKLDDYERSITPPLP
ncbi:MAG: histidine-type phosphatase [Prevotella sp.]|nr:histidine-type phosphatase [Prevotella sp.]